MIKGNNDTDDLQQIFSSIDVKDLQKIMREIYE